MPLPGALYPAAGSRTCLTKSIHCIHMSVCAQGTMGGGYVGCYCTLFVAEYSVHSSNDLMKIQSLRDEIEFKAVATIAAGASGHHRLFLAVLTLCAGGQIAATAAVPELHAHEL